MTTSSRGPRGDLQGDRRAEARRAGAFRDAGLRRVSRLTGWTVAVAVGLTGALSEVAAHAFPGHSKHAVTTNVARPRAAQTAPPADSTTIPPAAAAVPEQPPPADTTTPQPPPAPPAPSAASGGAVSGGS